LVFEAIMKSVSGSTGFACFDIADAEAIINCFAIL